MAERKCKRTYVSVIAIHSSNGNVTPLEIKWKNGYRYEIDRIVDVKSAVATKAGGSGMRYTVRIVGKETFLFLDEGKWFVEEKSA